MLEIDMAPSFGRTNKKICFSSLQTAPLVARLRRAPRALPGFQAGREQEKEQEYNHKSAKFDDLGRSQKTAKRGFSVIPAKAGIQQWEGFLDPGFRRGDAPSTPAMASGLGHWLGVAS